MYISWDILNIDSWLSEDVSINYLSCLHFLPSALILAYPSHVSIITLSQISYDTINKGETKSIIKTKILGRVMLHIRMYENID